MALVSELLLQDIEHLLVLVQVDVGQEVGELIRHGLLQPEPDSIFLSRVKTEKVEKSPGGKMIKFPSSNNANLSEGNV